MILLIKVEMAEKEILKNLLSLYLHELSRYTNDLEINNEGLFEYDSLDLFFEDEKLIPYFVKYEQSIIGFILLSKSPYAKPGTDYSIQEFFILNQYRKRGLAQLVMKEIMKMYIGKFSIIILKSNEKAIHFWRKFYLDNHIVYEENDETHLHYPNCLYHIFELKKRN